MRFATLIACAALVAPATAGANELMRVYELALQNDTQLRAAESAWNAALSGQTQASGVLFWPQVNAFGNTAEQRDKITFPGPPSPGLNPLESTSEPHNFGLNVNWVVFNAELWNRWQQASSRAAAAEAAYRSAQQGVALRVTEAFFNVLGAADAVRFADAEKRAVERQLELANRRFEVGLSAVTDVQEAQARFDLTVAQLIEAEQALASAREALAEITGSSEVALQALREEIPLTGPDPDSVADWVKAAGEGNLDLVASRIQAEIARQEIDVSRSGHYPTLNVFGQYIEGESSGFNTGNFEQDLVQLQLRVPLFAGFSTEAGVNVAKSTYEQRLSELERTRRVVERTTRNAYQGVIAGVARVRALNQAVVSNTTALEASEVGLEVGTRTAVDVLNAQRELYRAQRDYARARYDYLLNLLRLKSAAGQLTGADLDGIDRLLVREAGRSSPG